MLTRLNMFRTGKSPTIPVTIFIDQSIKNKNNLNLGNAQMKLKPTKLKINEKIAKNGY